MAIIEVDHKKLRQLAADIDDYCDLQDRTMKAGVQSVSNALETEWRGQDAKVFLDSWGRVNNDASVTAKFRAGLVNCRDMLKKSADIYEAAQIEIVNRASKLSR